MLLLPQRGTICPDESVIWTATLKIPGWCEGNAPRRSDRDVPPGLGPSIVTQKYPLVPSVTVRLPDRAPYIVLMEMFGGTCAGSAVSSSRTVTEAVYGSCLK